MSPSDPLDRDRGVNFVRAVIVLLCVGGALLAIALVTAMGRWMVG